jgi:uncharacterized protein YdaT
LLGFPFANFHVAVREKAPQEPNVLLIEGYREGRSISLIIRVEDKIDIKLGR